MKQYYKRWFRIDEVEQTFDAVGENTHEPAFSPYMKIWKINVILFNCIRIQYGNFIFWNWFHAGRQEVPENQKSDLSNNKIHPTMFYLFPVIQK